MKTAIHALALHAPAADAERIATALAAVASADAPRWSPAVLPDGSDTRSCDIKIGDGAIVVVESTPAALPGVIALTVPDAEAAAERLSAAGVSATPWQGGEVKAFAELVPGFAIQLLEA